ncbi:MAG: threonyl-tRNA synthetase editing domain-containing protein [Atribacterota bacterium]
MKLLMIYAEKFAYQTRSRTLETVEEYQEDRQIENVLAGFIQVEKEDEEKMDKVETKLIKNLKWAAKKNNTNCILLHSFAHLSLSKANSESTKKIFDNAEKRLKDVGYELYQTPFGYFLDLDLKAPGKSLARVFKEF